MTILLFVLILGILVFVHEFGHFWAARRSGVRVEEFGFGFPPKLVGWRRGQTIYSLNLIPFGGFVRLFGEQSGGAGGTGSFQSASLGRKIFIMAAGVLMNYALAWVLLTSVFATGITVDTTTTAPAAGTTVIKQNLQAVVTEGGAADRAGLQTGDEVLSINDQTFTTTGQLADFTRQKDFPTLQVRLQRDGQIQALEIQPNTVSDPTAPHYNFGLVNTATIRYPWYQAPWVGLRSTVSLSWQSVVGFGQVIGQLINSGQLSQDVAGPVGIAILTGEVSRLGLSSLLQFTALLSISLAVINFLPIPALDGGRAFLLILQRLIRREFNPRIENYIHAAGFYALLLMILLISIRDVQRFSIIDRVFNIFR